MQRAPMLAPINRGTGTHNSQLRWFICGDPGLSVAGIDTLGKCLGLSVVRQQG